MKLTTRSLYTLAVERTIDQLLAHLDEAVSLSDLARQAGLSAFHFHRVFRGMVGETPLELTRRMRLERAAWRLATTGRPVVQIALDAGFETHEAFTRAFHERYGSSPTDFRESGTRRVELAASSGVHYAPNAGPVPFSPRDSGGASMVVQLVAQPAQRVAAASHRGPYNQIGEAFVRLDAVARSSGWHDLDGLALIAIYHDDPESTPVDELRSDAGLVVPADLALPASLVERTIPAGRYARAEHAGPYDRLGDTWARFMGEWLPASGCRVRDGLSYEHYRNTPAQVAPADLRTDLYLPIE
jgi:AraC family transcriptional regulator